MHFRYGQDGSFYREHLGLVLSTFYHISRGKSLIIKILTLFVGMKVRIGSKYPLDERVRSFGKLQRSGVTAGEAR